MYTVILVIWTATAGSAAYVIHEVGAYQSVEACNESTRNQKVDQFKCISKKG